MNLVTRCCTASPWSLAMARQLIARWPPWRRSKPRTSVAHGLAGSGLLRRAFQARRHLFGGMEAWRGPPQPGAWGRQPGRRMGQHGAGRCAAVRAVLTTLAGMRCPRCRGSLASHRRRLCRGGLIIRTAGMLRGGAMVHRMCLGARGADRRQPVSRHRHPARRAGRYRGRQRGRQQGRQQGRLAGRPAFSGAIRTGRRQALLGPWNRRRRHRPRRGRKGGRQRPGHPEDGPGHAQDRRARQAPAAGHGPSLARLRLASPANPPTHGDGTGAAGRPSP